MGRPTKGSVANGTALAAGEGEHVPPVVNVVVRELVALERFVAAVAEDETAAPARVHRLPARAARPDESRVAVADGGSSDEGAAAVGAGLRAVVPPVQSFAAGRRR